MRKILLPVLLILAASACTPSMPEPRTVRVSDRVYVLLGPIQHANKNNQGYMVNSTVIIGDRGVILVDPGGSREVGQHLLKSIRRITTKPVTHVVNTHFHGDHHLGNIAFDNAIIISSAKCREQVMETGYQWLQLMEQMVGHKLPGTRPVAASKTMPGNSRMITTIHGVKLIFWVPPGSHSAGDLMLYLPDDKVLVAGDILVNGVVPTMQDGNIKNWLLTLVSVENKRNIITYVPGHGPLMSLPDVRRLHRQMQAFYDGVKRAYKNDVAQKDIRKSLQLSDWEKLERSYVIGRNIQRAYLEIELDDSK